MRCSETIERLAGTKGLGALLDMLRARDTLYEILAHWKQGEFHHDLVLKVDDETLPGVFLVVSTNCNGGVKAVKSFSTMPSRGGLWARRCPDNTDFEGQLPPLLAEARTEHYFNPCRLLVPSARSEIIATQRKRQHGGGWLPIDVADDWFER